MALICLEFVGQISSFYPAVFCTDFTVYQTSVPRDLQRRGAMVMMVIADNNIWVNYN